MNSETQLSSTYKGLQGATAHSAATARNKGRTPFFFDKCTGFFCMRHTTHGTDGFTSHPKDDKCLGVLLKDTSVTAGDSKPHSDQNTPEFEFGVLKGSGHLVITQIIF